MMKYYYLVELKNGSRNFKAICEEKIVIENVVKDTIESLGRLIDIKAFKEYHEAERRKRKYHSA